MDIIEKLFVTIIPLIFIYIGADCVFNNESAYKKNLKVVENFANQVKNIPILNSMANQRVKETKKGGIWFIRIWGVTALIIGTITLYAAFTQVLFK